MQPQDAIKPDAIKPASSKAYDLVIVGGGMAGMALAAGLAQTHLKLAIVDIAERPPNWQATTFNSRVSALSETSRQLLDRLGAWSAMQKLRVNPYQGMRVWDSQGTAEVAFSAAEAGVAHLGYLVENSVTQLGLLDVVAKQTNLDWYLGVEAVAISDALNNQGQRRITLSNGIALTAVLIVGADGANSRIRTLGAFKTREWNYGHHALVTSVRMEKSHSNAAWQSFSQQGILAFLPLNLDGDNHWCSIVWSTHPEQAAELMHLDATAFNQRLTAAFEGRLGQVEFSEKREVVPLRQRHAINYVKSGLVLIADAAHTIHPLAGQGINLGFADVAALTQVIKQAVINKQPLGSLTVLNAYQHQRKPDNLAMMALMESFKHLFASQNLPVLLLRNLGMKLVNTNPWIKRQLITQALGLRVLAQQNKPL
ncbi:MAG TPA: FAD-dependent monooxygenase [Marinospirillum sp.]|uniref:FAD-dependent monooxygenase n=1 Tax=Marinospirillum sp. TaxID=2183934 RepID=UPI002B46A1CA|nr:FAD-dependent monooxygenase [Marinospirillum sp.]HKM14619.1 FAD-dependent monooxygenase [Marinospirillum sp.]